MAGISLPGVSDKYKTNDLIEALMNQERLPLEREKKTLDGYKIQQDAWRSVNKNMSSLRDTVKSLYSFENPFNNKTTTSTDENAISATAGRDATFESFKIDVLNPATADRFLSKEIDKSTEVPAGTYKFTAGDKSISMKWKGGKIQDFVTSLNRRGGDTIKASLIGISPKKQSLLIESLRTGIENKLVFEESALEFAESIGMIQKIEPEPIKFSSSSKNIKVAPEQEGITEQSGLPAISKNGVTVNNNIISVPPRGSFSLDVPKSVSSDPNQRIDFSLSSTEVEDITIKLNEKLNAPELPDAGRITFKGITVNNIQSDTTLPQNLFEQQTKEPLLPVKNTDFVYIQMKDGSEVQLPSSAITKNEDGSQNISIHVSDYPEINSIIIRNRNTGEQLAITNPESFNKNADLGFEPINPASIANDAKIKYEGITITRPTNEIDDVVPNVTLNVKAPTDKTATISIEPDTESAKESLITFIGTYNQVIAELNILTQNKPELITELEYLSESEIEKYTEWLGLFQSDFTLTNGKSSMQTIMSASYPVDDDSSISMLSHIGISTSADSYTGFSSAKLRGYLEINEKKLDEALEKNLLQIKDIFGYDSDGDLIIDSGIAYQLDNKLQSFVQTGGILSSKISSLDTKISTSESKISKLEVQLDSKEQELRRKYTQMESTLNSLESQSESISNTFNNNKSNR